LLIYLYDCDRWVLTGVCENGIHVREVGCVKIMENVSWRETKRWDKTAYRLEIVTVVLLVLLFCLLHHASAG
jgi:hypothetical protein